MTRAQTSIAVMGSGAVGGYFGARLAAAGENVAFIARGAHLDALRRDELLVKSVGGDFRARGLFTDNAREVGPVDLILFCVKSYDTETAAEQLAPMINQRTIIRSEEHTSELQPHSFISSSVFFLK